MSALYSFEPIVRARNSWLSIGGNEPNEEPRDHEISITDRKGYGRKIREEGTCKKGKKGKVVVCSLSSVEPINSNAYLQFDP